MKQYFLAFLFSVAFLAALPAMALDTPRTPTTAPLPKDAVLFTWLALDGDDTGVPVDVSSCVQLTVHVYSSTYGSSTVTVEGSNDTLSTSTEYVGLTDPQGTAISKTADGIEAVEEHPKWFKPRTASGTAASVGVGLLCQRYR
jgi:hypothetical protein